jgi:hypothetical protein
MPRTGTDSGASKPPRHAAPTSISQRIRFWLSIAVGIPASGFALWWGLKSGSLSLIGLAIGCLGTGLTLS